MQGLNKDAHTSVSVCIQSEWSSCKCTTETRPSSNLEPMPHPRHSKQYPDSGTHWAASPSAEELVYPAHQSHACATPCVYSGSLSILLCWKVLQVCTQFYSYPRANRKWQSGNKLHSRVWRAGYIGRHWMMRLCLYYHKIVLNSRFHALKQIQEDSNIAFGSDHKQALRNTT